MKIHVTDVKCPKCGVGEMHPRHPDKLAIRAFKVHHGGRWWSQCLVCAGYYDPATGDETPDKFDRAKGWF